MSVFTVDLKNQPGEFARLCEAMGGSGINLILCATTRGRDGTVVFSADDEASAGTVLQDNGIGYAMRPALTIRMENQPGAGAAIAEPLRERSTRILGTHRGPQRMTCGLAHRVGWTAGVVPPRLG
jgi:hypothetical protein